ncbi:MAG: hypothetical protein WBE83_10735 [Candidatus Cybelea sp.]|jgi:hypothetical protein
MSAQPIEIAMAHLEGANEQLDKRLGELNSTIESRFAQVDGRFSQIDGRFSQIDGRIDDLGKKVDGLRWRMTSLIVVTWITTILAVLIKH